MQWQIQDSVEWLKILFSDTQGYLNVEVINMPVTDPLGKAHMVTEVHIKNAVG